jgi:hypothetical protein
LAPVAKLRPGIRIEEELARLLECQALRLGRAMSEKREGSGRCLNTYQFCGRRLLSSGKIQKLLRLSVFKDFWPLLPPQPLIWTMASSGMDFANSRLKRQTVK